MSERDAFLRCILENPAEDVARLVFADWLQEQADAVGTEGYFDEWYGRFIVAAVNRTPYPIDGIWGHRLFGSQLYDVLAPFAWTLGGVTYHTKTSGADKPAATTLHVERGFVSRIELPCAAFLEHAEALFRAHPVTEVKLSGKACDFTNDSHMRPVWWARPDDRFVATLVHHLPWMVFDNLQGGERYGPGERTQERHPPQTWTYNQIYESLEDANHALSRACVRLGRDRAKLPPLPTLTPAS